jgi:hypothetical protein
LGRDWERDWLRDWKIVGEGLRVRERDCQRNRERDRDLEGTSRWTTVERGHGEGLLAKGTGRGTREGTGGRGLQGKSCERDRKGYERD